MLQFGTGVCYGTPNAGNLAVNPTPVEFGVLQDVKLDIAQILKELKGQYKFPVDVAASDMKITGSASYGQLEIGLFNQLYFADTFASGVTGIQPHEAHNIPAATPFTITIAPPNTGTFVKDLGVKYTATGAPLTLVASGPTTGQYSQAAGIYTFATADEGLAVLISYTYSITGGSTLTVNNQFQGYGPVFSMDLLEPYQGQNGLHLFAVRASKLSAPLKQDGYQIVQFDFEAYANVAGQVMQWFQTAA